MPDAYTCETVEDCTAECVRDLAFVDDACAPCAVERLSWRGGGCNDFECVCDGPSWGSVEAHCAHECEATIERVRSSELARPSPPPLGHLPVAARVLSDATAHYRDVVALGGVVWLCSDRQVSLMRLSPALDPLSAIEAVGRDTCVLAAGTDDRLLVATMLGDEGVLGAGALRAFDADGAEVWTRSVPLSAAGSAPSPHAFALTANDEIAVVDASSRMLSIDAVSGQVLAEGRLEVGAWALEPSMLRVQSDGTRRASAAS